jgi:lipopolysaccharide transport system permease protein
MAVVLGGMGPLYAQLFDVPIMVFFPHLSLGVIIWTFINVTVNEGGTTFVAAAPFLKSRPYPLSAFIWRIIARNLVTLLHQLPVFLPVAYFAGIRLTPATLLFLPGLLLLVLALHALAMIAAIVCTRFRDVPQIIASIMQLAVFMTPVLWLPSSLPPATQWIVRYNPFAQVLDIVRLPLLGQYPAAAAWLRVAAWTAGIVLIAALLFKRFHRRIIYWL